MTVIGYDQSATLNPGEILDAFQWMLDQGTIFAHGNFPPTADDAGVVRDITDGGQWEAFRWNPPNYIENQALGQDASASAKPSWDDILVAVAAQKVVIAKEEKVVIINRQATRRIGEVYHSEAAEFPDKEFYVRLDPPATIAALNATKDDLIDVCHALESSVASATLVSDIEALDVTSDAAWALPPEGEG